MAIKGSLREAGLGDICQLLSIGQKTGCLSVTDRSRFGQIFFDRGRITFATIVNRRDRLGDLLVRDGAIDHAQLMEGVDAQNGEPDRRLGEILLEKGFIDRPTLTRFVERQIQEAIYFLFTWKRGNFYFEVEKTPGSGEILISVNPESLLLEGARRVDEWSIIEEKVQSMDLVFGLERERLEAAGVELTPQQREVTRLLDGERSVEEVAGSSGLGEFETARALYALLQAGFAYRVGRRTEGVPVDTPDVDQARNLGAAFYDTAMLEDAEREFRRVLQNDPHDQSARRYMALIALRRGDPGEAVRRLTTLLETGGPRLSVYLALAYALRVQRQYGKALRVLADAHRVAPRDPRVPLAEGATSLFGGDPIRAAEALARYRDMVPSDQLPPSTYYYCAGLAALVNGQIEVAEAVTEEGLRAHPGSPPLYNLGGNIAERRADMAAAERAYQRAAEEDPALPQAHRNLGDLAQRRGLIDEALEHYRRAAELDPELGDELYCRLADIHYRRSERDEAVRCWRKAVALNPDNESARNQLEVVASAGR